jgi:hypothetical protein
VLPSGTTHVLPGQLSALIVQGPVTGTLTVPASVPLGPP